MKKPLPQVPAVAPSMPYSPPKMASAPASRPMPVDAGKPNALPKHALHARGRNRGMKGC
jgi:hypothetical protein